MTYSIAFIIEKKGVNLQDPSGFTHAYQAQGPADWRLMGVLATDPKLEPLLTYGGVPCHLHGIQKHGNIGGHVIKAIPESIRASVYPIFHTELNLADLVLEVISASDERIVLKASNRGLAHCDHIQVTASLPDGKMALYARLATLAPLASAFIDLRATAPIQGSRVTFTIDPQNEIVESDEGNNTVVLTVL